MSGAALVTGAFGFIGRHAARRLARGGWNVSGIGHGHFDDAARKAWGLNGFVSADVTLDGLRACGVTPGLIVHCAGGSTVGASLARPLADFERSVATTAAVLEFARTAAPGARVVFISSAAVYGDAGAQPLREGAVPAPISPYGVHKRAAEELCRMFGSQFGVASIVLRLFSVYGARMRKQLLWDAANRLRSGNATFGGTGRELRDWLHVEDAAALIERAGALASRECPVINGGTGVGTPVSEVLAGLASALGTSAVPRFSGEKRPGDPESLVADVAKATAAGWRAEIDWKEGVLGYAAWFREAQR